MAGGNHEKYGTGAGTRNRRDKLGQRVALRGAYFFVLLGAAVLYSSASKNYVQSQPTSNFRQLHVVHDHLSSFNATNATALNPPTETCFEALNLQGEDNFNEKHRWLAAVIYIIGILYVFLGIAVVCDDHFCVSLEVICDILDLDEAVAGATFMAAGSSAPELATSLVTVFSPQKDGTGLGTILGSAVFNLVMIVCLSGLFGEGPEWKLRFSANKDSKGYLSSAFCKDLPTEPNPEHIASSGDKGDDKGTGKNPKLLNPGLFLDWRPLFRDATFYILSLIICVIFALTPTTGQWCHKAAEKPDTVFSYVGPDGKEISTTVPWTTRCQEFEGAPAFDWWEGLVLCFCYGFYIHSMIKNEELMHWMAGDDANGKTVLFQGTAGKEQVKIPSRMQPHIWGFIFAKEKLERDEEALMASDEPADGSDEKDSDNTAGHIQSAASDDIGDKPTVTPPTPDKPAIEQSGTTQFEARQFDGWKHELDALKAKVAKIQDDLAPMVEFVSDKKHMYKVFEEEEDLSCMDHVYNFIAWPWDTAFTLTIPACDRDSYQVWEDEVRYVFPDPDDHEQTQPCQDIKDQFGEDALIMPVESRKLITREREGRGLDVKSLHLLNFLKGKYKRKKVLTWYNRSKIYILSFVMSITWIGITSFLMVFCAQRLGCFFGVGPFLMGLVVLAAGTSIPDALSSVVVAKEGDGDMAVANAIGSNVFNIFLGIGMPMFFSEFIADSSGNFVPYKVVDTLAVVSTSGMLVIITIIMYLALVCGKWVLTKKMSFILMIMFFVYIGLGVILDLGLIPIYNSVCDDQATKLSPSVFSCEGNCPGWQEFQRTGIRAEGLCNWAEIK